MLHNLNIFTNIVQNIKIACLLNKIYSKIVT